jgi:hypothetical protein
MTRTSEKLDSTVLENHDESTRVNEISTNYIDCREYCKHICIIVDIYFSTTVANNLSVYWIPGYPDPLALGPLQGHIYFDKEQKVH